MPEHHPLHHLRDEVEEQLHDPDLLNLDTVLETPLIEAPASARDIIRKGGPRMLRDAVLPFLVFWAVYTAVGLVPGVLAATATAIGAWLWERRNERTGVMATLVLGLIFVRAGVTLAANSATGDEELAAKIYLAQPILTAALTGLAFLVSVIVGRPLAGLFASDMYSFPPEVRASASFRRVFNRVSLAWAMFTLTRSAVRFAVLGLGDINVFVLFDVLTGLPLGISMGVWSVWYARKGMQESDEWGWAFRGEQPPPHLAHAAALFAAKTGGSAEDVEAVGQRGPAGEGAQQPTG